MSFKTKQTERKKLKLYIRQDKNERKTSFSCKLQRLFLFKYLSGSYGNLQRTYEDTT